MGVKVFQIGTFQAEFQTHGLAVFQDLDLHPATTAQEIADRLTLDLKLVRRILGALEGQFAAQREHDASGVEFWWTATKLGVEIVTMYQAARDWLAQKDGVDIEQMSIDLAVHYGVAKRLASFLQQEGLAKLVVDDA